MKHLLFHITLLLTLILCGTSESFASVHGSDVSLRKDKVQKVEQKENSNDALITEAQSIGNICNSRPQRIIPLWGANFPSQSPANKLQHYNNRYFQSLYLQYGGTPRQETAPIHFDVASRYYVICLRHLIC